MTPGDGGRGRGAADVICVSLPGVPVSLFRRMTDHYEELLRECALLRVHEPRGDDTVPGELPRIADELENSFHDAFRGAEAQVEAAELRAVSHVDVSFALPRSAVAEIAPLEARLEAIERFSEEGKLLAVPPPGEVVAFRRWYLGEVERQLRGGAVGPAPAGDA